MMSNLILLAHTGGLRPGFPPMMNRGGGNFRTPRYVQCSYMHTYSGTVCMYISMRIQYYFVYVFICSTGGVSWSCRGGRRGRGGRRMVNYHDLDAPSQDDMY